jgi:hypothetical protein
VSWAAFHKGQPVQFYTADGWKKGVISTVYDNSCSVLWSVGSTQKTTRIYDCRNIKRQ